MKKGYNTNYKIFNQDKEKSYYWPIYHSCGVIVLTNGCFDILHAGHVTYLEQARNLGDNLIVGLNSDKSVKELKGPERPYNTEENRAIVLAGLECVDRVVVFDDSSVEYLIHRIKPQIYVKGGAYTIDTIPQNERRAVEEYGGKIVFANHLTGLSSTSIIEKIKNR